MTLIIMNILKQMWRYNNSLAKELEINKKSYKLDYKL